LTVVNSTAARLRTINAMDAPTEGATRLQVALRSETGLLDQALTRAGGAPLVRGNHVRILRDAAENYPAWLEAIRGAEDKIYFENYFIGDDDTGAQFAAALAARARAGVRVRLVYDWLGSLRRAPRRFWRDLAAAGVDVRCFNPLRLQDPLVAVHRDHRKAIAIDGRIGFVSGLCVSREWVGDPERGRAPWRDTGLELRGPAVHDVECAFAQVWNAAGAPMPAGEIRARDTISAAGDVAVRVVANTPGSSGVFRLDQLIAAAARRVLWLTDAYFAGVAPYVQALRAAARDGVDVRLLVPGASDIPTLRPLTQAGYRPLLEAGVRVYEWNGPMLHAKTAVADGRWARVGSSNLNIASWMSNYELDVVVEDEGVASAMEQMYLRDLDSATEIVLKPRSAKDRADIHARGQPGGDRLKPHTGTRARGSASRAAAGALRLGRAVGAALTRQRVLELAEARLLALAGAGLLAVAVLGALWPLLLAVPIIVSSAWLGAAFLARAYAMRRARRSLGLPVTRIGRTTVQSS
jgi:cardiolipin synthase